MRNFNLPRAECFVWAILPAGCGGSQTTSTDDASFVPVTISSNYLANSVSNDLTRDSRLFVANNATSKIIIYPADVHDPRPIGSISSGVYRPYNLAVDQKGTLHVQNGNNTITEYHSGQTVISKTLTEPGIYTAGSLTVGSDGTVYAVVAAYGGRPAEVLEFAGETRSQRRRLPRPRTRLVSHSTARTTCL